MAKTTSEYEREFVAAAKEQTGHTVEEWMEVVRQSGKKKHAEIRNWLKSDHGLDHMRATFLTFMFENGGKPAFEANNLVETLFANKLMARELYDALEQKITTSIPEARFVPKKTYVSIDGDKVMGCVTPVKDGVKVGLDLGDMPFEGRVLKAKGLGAMPNVTHMVEVKTSGDINDELLSLVQTAYTRTQRKKK